MEKSKKTHVGWQRSVMSKYLMGLHVVLALLVNVNAENNQYIVQRNDRIIRIEAENQEQAEKLADSISSDLESADNANIMQTLIRLQEQLNQQKNIDPSILYKKRPDEVEVPPQDWILPIDVDHKTNRGGWFGVWEKIQFF